MPQVTVIISQPLRKITGGVGEVSLTGSDIGQILNNLNFKYPGIGKRLTNEGGEVRRYINIYINDENIKHIDSLKTVMREGDEVSILVAVAGGCCISATKDSNPKFKRIL